MHTRSTTPGWFRSVRLARVAGVAAFAAAAPAQTIVERAPIALQPGLVAFDSARGRLVTATADRRILEFDGASWFRRPGLGPDLVDGRFAYPGLGMPMLAYGVMPNGASATWTYDGAVWQDVSPTVQPPPRHGPGLAADPARRRVVLFGGQGTLGYLGDTWEWDGFAWQAMNPSASPPARSSPGMAADPRRGVVVMFGGWASPWVADTWEWDGALWRQRNTATGPGPCAPAMAYDPSSQAVLLFGGGGFSQDETWSFDGAMWTRQQPAVHAGAGFRSGMVTDDVRGGVLLLGGADATEYELWSIAQGAWQRLTGLSLPLPPPPVGYAVAADPASGSILRFDAPDARTLHWTGTQWQFANPPASPSARVLPMLWADGHQAWLFGGLEVSTGQPMDDTWRWDGVTWTLVPQAVRPSARHAGSAVCDPGTGRAVLYGGGIGQPIWTGTPALDTWTFDGTQWQRAAQSAGPGPRLLPAMAFDPLRGRTVLFGGQAGANWDTWEWNGSLWVQALPAHLPTVTTNPRSTPAMAWDAASQHTALLLTGISPFGVAHSELWHYDGSDWTQDTPAEPLRLLEHSVGTAAARSGRPVFVNEHGVHELVAAPATAVAFGSACTAGPVLSARSPAQPGNVAFGYDVAGAVPWAVELLVVGERAAATPLGSCTLWVGGALATHVLVADAGGFASLAWPLPASPRLLGTPVCAQVALLAPALPGGFTMTAGLRVVVGE